MINRSQELAIQCHCGSEALYTVCCCPFISKRQVPVTAEQLMRSRYSAFVLGEESYLLATWHPTTRPSRVRLDDNQRWLGLRILDTEYGGKEDATGSVEFVARYKVKGKAHRLHEISRFEKVSGGWLYLDGKYL